MKWKINLKCSVSVSESGSESESEKEVKVKLQLFCNFTFIPYGPFLFLTLPMIKINPPKKY